jgi:hypothetical protein
MLGVKIKGWASGEHCRSPLPGGERVGVRGFEPIESP